MNRNIEQVIQLSKYEYDSLVKKANMTGDKIDELVKERAKEYSLIKVNFEDYDSYYAEPFEIKCDVSIEPYCLENVKYRDLPDNIRRGIRRVVLFAEERTQKSKYAKELKRAYENNRNMRKFCDKLFVITAISLIIGFIGMFKLL